MSDAHARHRHAQPVARPTEEGGRGTNGTSRGVRLRGFDDLRKVHRELARQARERAEAQAALAREVARQEQEKNLFVHLVGPVVPMRALGRAPIDRPRPEPVPLQRRRDEQEVLRSSLSDEFDAASLLETDDQLSYARVGVGPDVLRRLRTGAWSVQGQIDLHGHTRDEAREALSQFLQHAGKQGWRCVRVVHGKGLGSPGRQPVLKGKVRNWLVQRQEVLAFAHATGPDGGAGAVIVLLDSGPARRR